MSEDIGPGNAHHTLQVDYAVKQVLRAFDDGVLLSGYLKLRSEFIIRIAEEYGVGAYELAGRLAAKELLALAEHTRKETG